MMTNRHDYESDHGCSNDLQMKASLTVSADRMTTGRIRGRITTCMQVEY